MAPSSPASEGTGGPSCLLFVPAVKSAYYKSALDLSHNLAGIVLDLEDSVSQKAKTEARKAIIRNIPALWQKAPEKCWLRINNRESPAHSEDLALVEELANNDVYPSLMYPKYSRSTDVIKLRSILRKDSQRLFVNIESFEAIENTSALFARELQIYGAAVGAEDLSAWLGIDRPAKFYSNPLFAYSAAKIACACHASGIAFWGNIWPFMVSEETNPYWLGEIQEDIHLGAHGKIIFHPNQIKDVNRSFAEAFQQKQPILEKLHQLLNASLEDGSLVALHHAKMIDGPEITRALRLLKRFPDLELSTLAQMFSNEPPTK